MSEAKSSTESKLEWPAKRVRDTFVEFFKKKDHTHWPSSKVVPYDDPTLLFTNAGMNQYKAIFLGKADPKTDLGKLERAANSQKCIRAGGKHNDLEDVGKDVYHHTFFEMLGNWSFGDYFKKEAIAYAWELLTEVYKIDPDRLYATYFGGDKKQGLAPDEEAKAIWLKYLPKERVLPFGCKDNFWEMGATGPCGPCTEIHYDRIGGRFVPERVNADLPDVVEIWNLVFIQFNREPDASLRSLPAKSIDTGMGFERLTSVLQDVDSNYDTDIFSGIFKDIQKLTGCPDYKKRVGEADVDGVDMAYRVIADHIRTLTFAITDGAAPGTNGRDYVLRRVCRRAVRYGKEKLGAPPLFFNKLVPAVVRDFGDAFPELRKNPDRVQQIILTEEKLFTRTLDKGLSTFRKAIASGNMKKGDVMDGAVVADLLTTFGFPYDLTELMAEELGIGMDKKGFDAAMKAHAEVSRGAGDKKADALKFEAEQVSLLKQRGVAVTDDSTKYDWTSTGSGPAVQGTVRAIFLGKTSFADEAKEGVRCGLFLDKTNFYAEAGGQVADVGRVTTADGATFRVTDCQVSAGFVMHMGVVESGTLRVGSDATTAVDYERRALIAKNHTATHVLNFALREVLATDVDQKGSIVLPEKLRFDFSADESVGVAKVQKIEEIVTAQVQKAQPVYRRSTPIAEAKKISTLRAVFGEKYPDPVVVVSVGADIQDVLKDPSGQQWNNNSIEFCGGTHIANTSEIGNFVVVSEESIAAGTRRIVGYTNKAADRAISEGKKLLDETSNYDKLNDIKSLGKAILKLNESTQKADIPLRTRDELTKRYNAMVKKKTKLFKKASKASAGAIAEEAKKWAAEATEAKAKFIVREIDAGGNNKTLKKAIAAFYGACDIPTFFVSPVSPGGKMVATAYVPKALTGAMKAGDWMNAALAKCGGRGGGKPGMANGNAKDSTNMKDALATATEMAEKAYGGSN